MKIMRTFSKILFVGCMICSLSLPAFATTFDVSEMSTYAGGDKAVRLVVLSSDGTIRQESDFTVAIPENASVEEELALTNATARVQSGRSTMPFAAYAGEDLISHTSRYTIASAGAAQVVGQGKLNFNYQILYAELHGVSGTAPKFNIRIESTHNKNVSTTGNILGEFSYLFMIDDQYYNGNKLDLRKNDTIKVWCSTTSGSMYVNDIYISCSQ